MSFVLRLDDVRLPVVWNAPRPTEVRQRANRIQDARKSGASPGYTPLLVRHEPPEWRLVDGLRTLLALRHLGEREVLVEPAGPVQQLRFRNWWPTLLNVAIRMHYQKRNLAYRADMLHVVSAQSLQCLEPAGQRRAVHYIIEVGSGSKVPDPDALYKPVQDGLVAAGLLLTDDWRGVRLTGVDFRSAQRKGLTVTLTDIADDPYFLGGKSCRGGKRRRRGG